MIDMMEPGGERLTYKFGGPAERNGLYSGGRHRDKGNLIEYL